MRFLLATDGSGDALGAEQLLLGMDLTSDDTVRVCSVVSDTGAAALALPDGSVVLADALAEARAREEQHARAALEAACDRIRQRGVTTESILRYGGPSHEILQEAASFGPDLLVLGTRGLGRLERFLLGSVATQVARHARQPVLIARGPAHVIRRVVLATDGSEHARAAVRFAAKLPLSGAARFTCVTAFKPTHAFPGFFPTDRDEFEAQDEQHGQILRSESDRLAHAAAQQLAEAGLQVSHEVLEGDAASAVLDFARADGADLVLCGARGVSLIEGLLVGSVADRLIQTSECSVLVVH